MANLVGGEFFDNLVGTEDRDIIRGNGGSDNLFGNGGNDDLYGGGGDDYLEGGAGLDKLYGGDGFDYFDYANPAHIVRGEIIDGGAGIDTIGVRPSRPGELFDFTGAKLTSIEQFAGAGAIGRFTFAQAAGLTTIEAFNLELAGSGAFTLNSDLLLRGVVRLVSYDTTLTIGSATNLYGGISVTGSNGTDTVIGNGAANTLSGEGGADKLYGEGGGDFLIGGLGRDQLYGGAGRDQFIIYSSAEMQGGEVYDGGADLDTLRVFASVNMLGVTITGIEDLVAEGGAQLSGAASQFGGYRAITADSFNIVDGGTATIAGVVAVNTINIRAAGVVLDLSASSSFSSNSTTIYGWTTSDTVVGSNRSESIYGGRGNDVLDGGAGDDVLVGGEDRDTLTGGAGADTFVYTQRNDSGVNKSDTITDFTAGDILDLSLIDADSTTDEDDAFIFVVEGSDSPGELFWSYDSTTNITTLRGDVDGGGVLLNDVNSVDFQIFFTGNVTGLGAAVIL